MSDSLSSQVDGPFGPADKVQTLVTSHLVAMYKAKFGLDITPHFNGIPETALYKCQSTGMLFWRPVEVAGNDIFYQQLSAASDHYYRPWRWEYGLLDSLLTPEARLLEIGCGRGYFLKHAEGRVAEAQGIEYNEEAIVNKVTRWNVAPAKIEDIAASEAEKFDLVCAFQVLEHVIDPASFIHSSLRCLKPGGRLAVSIPNYENLSFTNQEDPLDLPPHHVNHFTPGSLEKIARAVGVELERVHVQPLQFKLPAATGKTTSGTSYKIARKVAQAVFSRLYSRSGEPGHTMLAVLRKPR